jgi:catechol 2,3-dioxygenase-like lactoylglutathione lyase family enzyme
MIFGAHILFYTADPEADRAFFRDVLEFPYVDVGHGWLIFALPPAEAALHPAEGEPRAEVYLMCDDLRALVASLQEKNVRCTEISEAPWGIRTTIVLPSGGEIGLYQPLHPTALGLKK